MAKRELGEVEGPAGADTDLREPGANLFFVRCNSAKIVLSRLTTDTRIRLPNVHKRDSSFRELTSYLSNRLPPKLLLRSRLAGTAAWNLPTKCPEKTLKGHALWPSIAY